MHFRDPVLLLVLAACASSSASPEEEVEAAPDSPVTVEMTSDGSVVVSTDAESARKLLGPIATESCKSLLEKETEATECTHSPEAGQELMVRKDGSAQLTLTPGQMQFTGAWKAGDSIMPFLIGGGGGAGVQLEWDHAPRPDGVEADVPSVLQITEEAPRAGLLLGTDRMIHGFTDGSMAQAAGLMQGDYVTSVNGDASLAVDSATFIQNLPKKAGKVAKIGVKRGEEMVEVRLRMQPYWQCHRVWGADAKQSVVKEPTGPAVAVACPPWAPGVVTAK